MRLLELDEYTVAALLEAPKDTAAALRTSASLLTAGGLVQSGVRSR